MSEHEQFLVITFVGSTHVLGMNEADELDEAALPGFATDTTTLFCGSLDNDQMVQARSTATCDGCCCVLTWKTSWRTRLHAPIDQHCACRTMSMRHVMLVGRIAMCFERDRW